MKSRGLGYLNRKHFLTMKLFNNQKIIWLLIIWLKLFIIWLFITRKPKILEYKLPSLVFWL